MPWYNVHKIYAGLRDSWLYAGSQVGRNLFLGICDWGNEDGNRTFDIFVDGTLIATENTSGRWGRDEFVEEEYSIPRELIDGKVTITVRFTGRRGHTAGGIYHVRLLHPEK